MKPAILINGPSSAGKSSTAIEICRLDSSFFHFEADAFVDEEIEKARIIETEWRSIRREFVEEAYSKANDGQALVIEAICGRDEVPYKLFRKFKRVHGLFVVGLKPALETLMEREMMRPNPRPRGIAMEQFIRAHVGVSYDLEIDNSQLLPDETARRILEAYNQKHNP